MTLDLFGYNGVLQFDQSVVNKLLCSFAYDRHLVESGGLVTDGDFFNIDAAIDDGDVHVYLELARPFVHISSADGSNEVTMHLPFSKVGVFVTRAGIAVKVNVPTLALVLFGVSIQKTQQGLSIDFSGLKAENVGLALIKVQGGPTDVGGSQINPELTLLVGDNFLEQQLTEPNTGQPVITAASLREQLAAFLRGGALGATAIPVAVGGTNSELAQWDLMLFGDANDRDSTATPDVAGADLLLFQDAQHGVGERTEAGDTLPAAPEQPDYSWTASLSAPVLADNIAAALDHDPYWVQGGSVNTPANPYGYMVVPGMQQKAYALPSGPGKVTVQVPQNGEAAVAFGVGALTPHSRAHVANLTRGVQVDFVADDNGAAMTSIRADAGERLALVVDAVSIPNDSATVIWRPRIAFQEGALAISVHYYHYIEHWCDLEGDVFLRAGLSADRTKPFAVTVTILDANASLPWWVYAVAWLGAGLLGQGVFAPILLALIPTIVHSLAQGLIGDKVSSASKALTDQVSAPSIENLVLALDQVDVHETGIQLAGRADAGNTLAWGRQAALSTQGGVVLETAQPNPVYMRLDWKPSLTSIDITCPVRWAVIRDRAAATFWSAAYDDLDVAALGRDTVTLAPGESLMAWVELDHGHAKVLFERSPNVGEVLNTGIRITWIAYREHVHRAVKLVNNLAQTRVGGSESITLEIAFYTYSGTIDLTTRKIFFSDETRVLGQENWFWDGQQVTDQGLTVPGGSVVLDAVNRRLIVNLDQVSLLNGPDIPSFFHWVEFQGTDVFGDAASHKILVQTPARTLRPRPIAFLPPWRINPLGDPIRDRPLANLTFTDVIAVLSPRLGEPAAAELGRTLADAMTNGATVLDGAAAFDLLSALSSGHGR